jgi:hypothetical protein
MFYTDRRVKEGLDRFDRYKKLVSCCWLLLAAAGCCWLLLAAAGCCWLLLATAGCCWLNESSSGLALAWQSERLSDPGIEPGTKGRACGTGRHPYHSAKSDVSFESILTI